VHANAALQSVAVEIGLQWPSPLSVILLTKTTNGRGAFRQQPKFRFKGETSMAGSR
jgi:hypothetical protein